MRAQKPHGFILIMSVYVLLVVSILSLSVSARSLAETMTARQYFWSDSAFSLAEAALDETMSRFRSGTFTDWSALFGGGDYSATVDPPTPPPPPDGGHRLVTAHGRMQSHSRDIEAIVNVDPFSVFQYPLFGDQLLDLRGNVETDSYNSTLGAYGACLSGCTGLNPVYNIGSNGDLGTNATYSDATVAGPPTSGIAISGSSVIINGQVNFGSGTTDPMTELTQDSITGNASPTITGSPDAVAMSSPLLLPPVVVPVGLTCTDLTILSFQTETLAPGEYCYHDLNMGAPNALGAVGPAVLNVTGNVTIYISGTIHASGSSFIGNTSKPSYTVFQLASPVGAMITTATLTGTTQLYGAIYAPDSAVTLSGTVDIYGSITAYSIRQTGDVQVHYDEGLEERDDSPPGGYTTDVMFWRDCDPSDGSGCST